MGGLWHTTQQTIHWKLNDIKGDPVKTTFAPWDCSVRLGLACLLAERTDRHEVGMDGHCSWNATLYTDHAAWWNTWFDLTDMTKKYANLGRVEATSYAPNRSFDQCQTNSNGGGNGSALCYDAFLVWWDQIGYHEEYLYTVCYQAAM